VDSFIILFKKYSKGEKCNTALIFTKVDKDVFIQQTILFLKNGI